MMHIPFEAVNGAAIQTNNTGFGTGREITRKATRVLDTLYLWQTRAAERRHLAELDTHLLADLGLTRADALGEADKPFWRA